MIDERNDNIQKIPTGQGYDYTTGCLLDYHYLKESYKMTAKYLSKQQELDANSKANHQINFTGNLQKDENQQFFSLLKKQNKPIWNFQMELWKYCNFILLWYGTTQYIILNVKLSNSHLNKLQLGITNGTEVTLNISSNVFGDSNDDTHFPYKLLSLTNTQVSRLHKAFANNSSANVKLSKT